MKKCTGCSKDKPLTEFYKKGKESRCKTCFNKRVLLYLYPNRDAIRGQKSSEARKKTQARYRENNRDKIRAGQRKWVKNNLPKVLAKTHKYQAAKLQRTPKWLTNEHLKQIEAIFIEAAELTKTGCPHEVYHIIPLCGNTVSGLHVPWNLQILPRHLNRSKHNKY
jgi:hypothetical protein